MLGFDINSLRTKLRRARREEAKLRSIPLAYDRYEPINKLRLERIISARRSSRDFYTQHIGQLELDIKEAEDEYHEKQNDKRKEQWEERKLLENDFIKDSDSNEESSSGSYLILALLLLPLMTFPMPLAFLFYGLLSWLWLGSWAMLNIFLVCTTAYLYSSGNIFLGSLMLFMIPAIFFIKLGKDIGSPPLSSMGPERFKYRRRRIALTIIWLVFCLLLSYEPHFTFDMVLIVIAFFAGYFIYQEFRVLTGRKGL